MHKYTTKLAETRERRFPEKTGERPAADRVVNGCIFSNHSRLRSDLFV